MKQQIIQLIKHAEQLQSQGLMSDAKSCDLFAQKLIQASKQNDIFAQTIRIAAIHHNIKVAGPMSSYIGKAFNKWKSQFSVANLLRQFQARFEVAYKNMKSFITTTYGDLKQIQNLHNNNNLQGAFALSNKINKNLSVALNTCSSLLQLIKKQIAIIHESNPSSPTGSTQQNFQEKQHADHEHPLAQIQANFISLIQNLTTTINSFSQYQRSHAPEDLQQALQFADTCIPQYTQTFANIYQLLAQFNSTPQQLHPVSDNKNNSKQPLRPANPVAFYQLFKRIGFNQSDQGHIRQLLNWILDYRSQLRFLKVMQGHGGKGHNILSNVFKNNMRDIVQWANDVRIAFKGQQSFVWDPNTIIMDNKGQFHFNNNYAAQQSTQAVK